jgi:putative spermidine/putrescine transport system ATP-binding protein
MAGGGKSGWPMDMSNSMITDYDSFLNIANVVKSYDGHTKAVDDISLAVNKGEFVTLLGPSGSGKTTTLMMVAGFENPDSGRIDLAGRSLLGTKPHKRGIGMVFQNYALFPHMTVARNIGYPLRVRRRPADEINRRVEHFLKLVDLTGYSQRYPSELSGGQQQRVALARALVFEPDILLLDEPLGALDKNLREQMQIEIKRIQQEVNITTIYVTHDQSEAMTMSDRIAVFNEGRIQQIAEPTDIYLHPNSRFVGSFIGDSNFLDATPTGTDDMVNVPGLGKLLAPDTHAAGDAVWLMVRPENIHPVGNETPDGHNVLEFKVSSIVHYGDRVLVVGECGGTSLRMRGTPAELALWKVGQQYRVGWAQNDAHLIARHETDTIKDAEK